MVGLCAYGLIVNSPGHSKKYKSRADGINYREQGSENHGNCSATIILSGLTTTILTWGVTQPYGATEAQAAQDVACHRPQLIRPIQAS
jgi:hypothetical protein